MVILSKSSSQKDIFDAKRLNSQVKRGERNGSSIRLF